MSARAFKLWMIALVLAVLLSAAPFPGAMLGFFLGLSIAFFVAGPASLAMLALQRAGVPVTGDMVIWTLAGLYGLMVVAAGASAWRAFARGSANEARLKCFGTAILLALPLMAFLSSRALVGVWR